MQTTNIYNLGLNQNPANYAVLTPISFLQRTASVYPDHIAQIHHDQRLTWAQTYARSVRLASALNRLGVEEGDTVSFIAPNSIPLFEAHFGVPMCGAVLNAINTRLDAKAISFMLQHAETKVLFVDKEFAEVSARALKMLGAYQPHVIHIDDPYFAEGELIGTMDYEEFLATGSTDYNYPAPGNDWNAITLNYTSGTTGNPKGVVYHHRGAYLNAISNAVSWNMTSHPVYLWTLPMFHCNGWCFPWTLAATAGTSVTLRHVRADAIYSSIRTNKVGYFCGAPIVLNLLNNADAATKAGINHPVKVMTAGAPPPAAVIDGMEKMGFQVTHVYGLTETYGPCVVCAWHQDWDKLDPATQLRLKVRQGVKAPLQEDLMIADPETLIPVPKDGTTLGEIFMRGNLVMKGYLKNPRASEDAFKGGWFRSGDLAVWHPDGYVEIKDRSKDIIISGGENISSIEIEDILYRHPDVAEAAVVAKPDPKWGETPCAFITLKAGAKISEAAMLEYCRNNLASFKTPKTLFFGELPKTSTGKIQKFVLREKAKELT